MKKILGSLLFKLMWTILGYFGDLAMDHDLTFTEALVEVPSYWHIPSAPTWYYVSFPFVLTGAVTVDVITSPYQLLEMLFGHCVVYLYF